MANIIGTAGNDLIDGTNDDDFIEGLGGDDQLNGLGGNDFLIGGEGDDTLDGGTGDDRLHGDAGNDILIGGDGSDFFRGGAGVDSFDGGNEDPLSTTFGPASFGDRISFFEIAATQGVIADLRTGIISNDGYGNVETMTGIESLGADTAFADTLHGNDGRNLLLASRGDTLMGYSGGDHFQLSGAAALIDGGTGVDFLQLISGTYFVPDSNGDGLAEIGPDMTEGWFVNLATNLIVDGFGESGTILGIEDVTGTELNDTIFGNADDNVLTGGAGDDRLHGNDGNDTLVGGDGSDFFRGGGGVDSFDGGSEDPLSTTFGPSSFGDRISFFEAGATQGVVADLRTGIISNDGYGNVETMTGIESLGADTAFADTLHGNDGRNLLLASAGDTLMGYGDDDLFQLSGAAALIDGGTGRDALQLVSGTYYVPDSDGDGLAEIGPAMTEGWFVNMLANDIVDGFGNVGTILGIEEVTGTELNDFIIGDNADNVLSGGAGDDNLRGNDGNDTLVGGDGSDFFRGGAGVDSFDGGSEDPLSTTFGPASFGDRISFFEMAATQAVVADLRTGVISNDGFGNAETMVGIESLGGDTAFADTFHGNDGRNLILASRNDNVWTYGDDDWIQLSGAAALLDGGAGRDFLQLISGTYLVPDSDGDGLAEIGPAMTEGWFVNLATNLIVDGFGESGTILGIEDVTGTELNDNIFGNAADNVLTGGAGGDNLRGNDGNDTLIGGDGNDLLRGGAGVDFFDGGANGALVGLDPSEPGAFGDRVSFSEIAATQGVVADLRTGIISNDGFGNVETMVGIESLGADTAHADTLHGDDSRNFLWGSLGDTLMGHGGDDIIHVSRAAATVNGGAGMDELTLLTTIYFLPDSDGDGLAEQGPPASAGWSVNLGSGDITDGFGSSGSVAGIENVVGSEFADTLIGSNGVNRLDGGDGDDVIDGKNGADTMNGGGGNDVLSGGNHADIFEFGAVSGDDEITDFKNNQDKIRFLADSGVDEFSDLSITALGKDVLITWGDGSNAILLEKTKLGWIDATDFLFG